MTLRILAPSSSGSGTADLGPINQRVDGVEAKADAADAKAVNARQMVLNRDPRLEAVEQAAAAMADVDLEPPVDLTVLYENAKV